MMDVFVNAPSTSQLRDVAEMYAVLPQGIWNGDMSGGVFLIGDYCSFLAKRPYEQPSYFGCSALILDSSVIVTRALEMGYVRTTDEEMLRVMDLDKKFRLRDEGFSRAAQFWAVIRMRHLDHGLHSSRLPNWVRNLAVDPVVFHFYWEADERRYHGFAPDDFDRAAEDLNRNSLH